MASTTAAHNESSQRKVNSVIGKSFTFTDKNTIKKQLADAGFINVKCLGSLPTWHYTSDNLKDRYNMSEDEMDELKKIIEDATPEEKKGFNVTETGFTIPIRYQVFLAVK